jgi:hypothetical protein
VLNDDGSEQTDGEGLSENNAVVHGQLHYWKPGTELEECHLYNHLPSPGRRLVQRMIHPLLLPIIDRLRPRYDPAFQLTPAP